MIRLILLILVAFAAWQGYLHYPEVLERHTTNEIVVRNDGDLAVDRLRLIVGGETFVREILVPGASATFHVRDDRDVRLKMVWFGAKNTMESVWTGPELLPGDGVERHTLRIYDNGRVTHQSERLRSR